MTPLASASITTLGLLCGLAACALRPEGRPFPWLYLALLAPVVLWGLFGALPLESFPPLHSLVHPMWDQAASIVAVPHTYLGLTPHKVLPITLAMLAACGVVIAAYKVSLTQPGRMLLALASIATFICMYGLVVFAMGNHQVLWLDKTAYTANLTATFINRNTFGTFAGLGVLLNMAMLLERIGEIPSKNRATRTERWNLILALVLKPRWPWALAALACFAAVVLSGSRAGLVVTLLGGFTFLSALLIGAKGARGFITSLMGLGLGAGLLMLIVLGQTMAGRMGTLDADASLRGKLFAITTEASLQAPLIGSGQGSFEPTFRFMRDLRINPDINTRIDFAHNTYLEIALTLGWPALILVLAALSMLLVRLYTGLTTRRRGVVYPALGLGGVALIGTHTLVDFSLQIIGFLMFAAAFVGLVLAASAPALKEHTAKPQSHPWAKLLPNMLGAGVLVLALILALFQVNQARLVSRAESMVSALAAGKTLQLSALQQARAQLVAAMPHTPTLGRSVAAIDTALAARAGFESLTGQIMLRAAASNLKKSLGANPADPYGWHRLAFVQNALGQNAGPAVVQSVLTGPLESPLAYNRLPLLVAVYPLLDDPDDRSLIEDNVATLFEARDKRTWRLIKDIAGGPELLAQALHNKPNLQERWQPVTKMPYPGLPNR